MAEYTLKNIPEEIYHRAQAAAENSLRSLNQEIIFRLRRSFDSEDARTTALHARWVMEALESGPAKPLRAADMDAAFQKGVSRGATPPPAPAVRHHPSPGQPNAVRAALGIETKNPEG